MTAFNINALKSFLRENYARNLVFKTDNIEIILVCWLPGQGADVHGHGDSDAMTFILEGEMDHTTYYEDGTSSTGTLKAGDLEYISPKTTHSVKNNSNKKLVTLHIYSPPLSKQEYSDTLGYANAANIQRLSLNDGDGDCFAASTPKKPKNIAIIGGGFSGTLAATQLMRKFQDNVNENIQIIMIERASRFSRGFAYSTNSPQHLLNVPAAGMSAFPDQPEHFYEWAHAREPLIQKDTFVPRMLYGEYLETVLNDAEKNKSNNISFTRINDEAGSIEMNEDGSATVFLSGGIQFKAHHIILAVGNYPPKNVKVKKASFYNSPLYQKDPWSSRVDKAAPVDAPVMLIGTGLTMIDKAIELNGKGLKAPIYAVSRHGLYPEAHDLNYKKVDYVIDWSLSKSASLRDLLKQFRKAVKLVESEGGNWRQVFDSIRPYTQSLWSNLSESDKNRFFRFIRPYWDMHRHRCPPTAAAKFNEMMASGQLKIIAGRVEDFIEADGQVTVNVRARSDQELLQYKVAKVINCTGSELDFCQIEDPLIIDLFTKGLIKADKMSLGLDADEQGALKDAEGNAQGVLYTLGPPLKGQLWETTAVPEIRKQAENLAQNILEKCRSLTKFIKK